jgi:hypothetical protein
LHFGIGRAKLPDRSLLLFALVRLTRCDMYMWRKICGRSSSRTVTSAFVRMTTCAVQLFVSSTSSYLRSTSTRSWPPKTTRRAAFPLPLLVLESSPSFRIILYWTIPGCHAGKNMVKWKCFEVHIVK